MRMAIGTSRARPFEASSSTPNARGPCCDAGCDWDDGAVWDGCGIGRERCARNPVTLSSATRHKAPSSRPQGENRAPKGSGQGSIPARVPPPLAGLINDWERRLCFMNVSDRAPDFTLPDENGQNVALKSLRGNYVVLYFFPKADTPG